MSDSTFNLGTVIDDAKKVITNPVEFYRNMPTEGGYANPLIFVAVMAAITGLMISIFSIVGFGGAGAMMAGGFALAAIIVFPIMAVIGSFIFAAIIFVIWKLMGSDKNYEVAYRCTAYSFAIAPIVMLLSLVPYLGGIIKTLWGAFLLYIASTEVHQIKAQTAKTVFGILAAIGLLLGISSEHTARKYANWGEKILSESNLQESLKQFENIQSIEDLEDIDAEEAGRQVGEFLKGLGKFSKGLEDAVEEAEREAAEE